MSELKKSTDGTYMYEHFGQKISMCMAVSCDKETRDTCIWHKRWEASRSLVGAYYGVNCGKCDYYKPI
jgi:hypothetical protein